MAAIATYRNWQNLHTAGPALSSQSRIRDCRSVPPAAASRTPADTSLSRVNILHDGMNTKSQISDLEQRDARETTFCTVDPTRNGIRHPMALVAAPTGSRRNRRQRLLRFACFEALAIVFTAASMWAVAASGSASGAATSVFVALPIVGAAAATLLPILLFAVPRSRKKTYFRS